MRNLVKKFSKIAFVFALVYTAFVACTDPDAYKEFIEGGEISYTGKIDSLVTYSGRDRIQIEGLIKSDPKITECRIFWNLGSDSLVVPIKRTSGVDTLRAEINGLGDNIYSFDVFTYDALGNKSISVSTIGQSYGDIFESILNNRPIITANLNDNLEPEIIFGGMDRTTGVFRTEVTYVDALTDEEKTVIVPIDSTNVTITNYKLGTVLKNRSLFLPTETAIDTFYSKTLVYKPVLTPKLLNASAPFERIGTGNNRYDLLKNWTANQTLIDFTATGMGWDGNYEGGVLAITTGYGGAPRDLLNGKLYQTVASGPSNFTLKASFNSMTNISETSDVSCYLVISTGSDIPNVEDVETDTNVLAYLKINNTLSNDFELDFTVPAEGDITIGFVYTSPGLRSHVRISSLDIGLKQE